MKTRLAFFLRKKLSFYKYICEVFHDNSWLISEGSDGYSAHEDITLIFRNKSLNPKIATFYIGRFGDIESGIKTKMMIGFTNEEAAKEFIKRCDPAVSAQFFVGGVLCYADPQLTYQISILKDQPDEKQLLKNILMAMHQLDPLDKTVITELVKRFDIRDFDPYSKENETKLISAYTKGAMIGLFANSKGLPQEMCAEIGKYLDGKSSLNAALVCRDAVKNACKEYDAALEQVNSVKPR